MRTFTALWAGQLASLIGNQLTGFSLGVWLFQRTGSATVNALVVAATLVPQFFGAPLIGPLVDRWGRRASLAVGYAGAGCCSAVLALLWWDDALNTPLALGLVGLASLFRAIEFPALQATVAIMVPTARLGRANGLVEVGFAVAQIVAPVTAAILLPVVGLGGIVAMDVATFVVALGVLAGLRFPAAAATEHGIHPGEGWWQH